VYPECFFSDPYPDPDPTVQTVSDPTPDPKPDPEDPRGGGGLQQGKPPPPHTLTSRFRNNESKDYSALFSGDRIYRPSAVFAKTGSI
jgi:hypothetical protein